MRTTRNPFELTGDGYLAGKMLVAMPAMNDGRFARAVIYVCAHSPQGAMGLVVNKPTSHRISFGELLRQLAIPFTHEPRPVPIQYGGPVEGGRGFVLHSVDYASGNTTLRVGPHVGLTATVDILKDLAGGQGPQQAVLALGYSGWGAGQLEGEIHQNHWLHCDADPELVFGTDLDAKWSRAVSKMGVDISKLSPGYGRA